MVGQRLSKGEGMCPHHQVWGSGGADDATLGLGNIFRCQKVILLPVSCVERMVVKQRVAEERESMALIFSSMCQQYNPGITSYAVNLCVDLSMRLSYGSSGCVSRAVLLWPMPPIASRRPDLTDPLLPMSTSALVALRRARMELQTW